MKPACFPPTCRPCPICSSGRKSLLWSQRFCRIEGGSLLSGYDVVICENCGLGFADNLPDQKAFDIYYREMSKYEALPGDKPLSPFDQRRYQDTAEVIGGFVSDRGARILDVGCATGGLLGYLRQMGYINLLGLDPSEACAEAARRLRGITVVTGGLGNPPPDLGIFDVVILGAVLEHIRDLTRTLRNVSGLLGAGGLLYVEVPDAAGFSCSGRTPPFQEFSIEHINYFSMASLANLLSVNGFREVFSRRYTLEESPGLILPAIKGAFRKTEKQGGIPGRDSVTEDRLRSYISASAEADRGISAIIDRLVKPRRPLIVWGTGTLTQRLLATGRLSEANIRAFVDSNPHYQGKSLAGVPIIPPEALRGRREAILISTIGFQDEIERTIRGELGLDNELVTFPPPGRNGDPTA